MVQNLTINVSGYKHFGAPTCGFDFIVNNNENIPHKSIFILVTKNSS